MPSSHSTSPSGLFDLAPEVLAEIQQQFAADWTRLMDDVAANRLEPPKDRRFAGQAWRDSPQHLMMAQAYLLSARTMQRMVDSVQADQGSRARLRFAIMQWVDALSPANFLALNPEAQASILTSAGEALNHGIANLLQDVGKGRISQTDETHFEVGRNVAVTPGAVVFQNPLFQLIQYAPSTPSVHAIPLVIVPPNINKFYVLDLQPANSFVAHAVAAGFTVFLISWRNPLAGEDDGVDRATWTDYLDQAVLVALDAARAISGREQVNALGFCVGGTLLASALALARARGQTPVASLTLLTTLLDFRDTGVLSVFVDETHALLREQLIGSGGLMWGKELATTFAFLRPNELVWNYVVSNYLKGETPAPFDLLHWNADSTNLPGPFFAWYFRNTYLENRLCQPGGVRAAGLPLDLSSIHVPVYVFGSREDHIVPWHSAYASTQLLPGVERFVLGASGHIAGVVNPPAKKRRSFWTTPSRAADVFPQDASQWLEGARENEGSWWPDWHAWLSNHAGPRIDAPNALGAEDYPVIEPAPGSYVKVRV
ncbi:MAG: class I poly(R)-hydroxyalkanoic acid synthase [Alcaligenaceae bacterium]|nr:MAG: class I poly(R)-hydroxyalkanoic acid synthase [Alcaligenaceae bacterium]